METVAILSFKGQTFTINSIFFKIGSLYFYNLVMVIRERTNNSVKDSIQKYPIVFDMVTLGYFFNSSYYIFIIEQSLPKWTHNVPCRQPASHKKL